MSDQDNDQQRPLFEGADELERTYAPEELPPDDPERNRVRLDDQSGGLSSEEPPAAAPVGAIGTSPSGAMAPVNIRPKDHGATDDSDTEATSSTSEDDTPDEEL